MFRFLTVVAVLAAVAAFAPSRMSTRRQMSMAAEKNDMAK